MVSDYHYLLENISKPALVIVSLCYILLALVFVPCPWNYLAAPLPAYIVFLYDLKDEQRQIRLGFAHDRVREIPQERMERALDDIERDRKKTRPLP